MSREARRSRAIRAHLDPAGDGAGRGGQRRRDVRRADGARPPRRSLGSAGGLRGLAASGELPQHVVQNAAVAVVVELLGRVDAQPRLELRRLAALRRARPRSTVFGGAASRPTMSNVSLPVSPRLCAFSPSLNCSGSTPMPMRLERWMRSKLSAMTALTPSSMVPLAAQSRELPVPYSLPARITSGVPSALYFMAASKIDIGFAARDVQRHAALGARQQQIAQPDVREGAAHHHLVVAAARSVGIEIGGAHALRHQIFGGGARLGDIAGGRDVIGGHRIAEHAPAPARP